ncbi:cytochrome P450 [Streptomyces sp. NPDC006314]|uniref:cytochrome P450 n=1 Tax=Streptomyces sp. NPDC006314 TaxID=3154475 RepID=UPI0033A21ACB
MTHVRDSRPREHAVDDELRPGFPMTRRCPHAPPPEYEELRARAPLVRATFRDRTVWLVTRHAEAQQVLTHPAMSSEPQRPGHPFADAAGSPRGTLPGDFIDMDPPEHDRYRRMLASEFGMRRVRAMRPAIGAVVDEVLDELSGRHEADLVEDFGMPVASLVMCRLLGVPYEDRDFFQERTRRMAKGLTHPEEAEAAFKEIRGYVGELAHRAERDPGDHLLGRLVRDRHTSGGPTHEELAGIAFLLLVSGHQTTANMIPLGVYTLLRNPEQLTALRADPGLWPSAVEELLRYHSIVDWVALARVATEDIPIGGQTIRAGEGVFVLGASANHDERVFTDPAVLDVHRGRRNHLAFGYGVHQCLGHNLARAELEIAYRRLFERLPDLRVLGDPEDLPFRYEERTFGLHRFPVSWS